MQRLQLQLVRESEIKSMIKLRFLAGKIVCSSKSETDLPRKCSLPKGNSAPGMTGQVSTKDTHV